MKRACSLQIQTRMKQSSALANIQMRVPSDLKKTIYIRMKFLISLCVILISLGASAQDSKNKLIQIVLTDSIVNHYRASLNEDDRDVYQLFHESGNYRFNQGIVEFEEHRCDGNDPQIDEAGIITKMKVKDSKATVKIHFSTDNNTRVKLRKEADEWVIQSRSIYRSWRFPKKQTRLIHHSFSS